MVLAVLAAGLALLPWLVTTDLGLRYAIDIDVYRGGAQALLAGDNLYTRSYQVGDITLPFTYPPLAAILFVPLAVVPYPVALIAWTLATAALLWWCLTVVLRHLLPGLADADHRVLGVWVLPLALLAEPVRETLGFGQVNIILMALVLADTLTRRPVLPRGVLIGLAAAIKLTPAVFILVFLVRRQWRDAAVTFASGVGFTLAAAAVSWENSLTYWFDTLRDTGRIGGEKYASNQSLKGALFRLGLDNQTLWFLLVLTALALIVGAMLRARTMLAAVLLASTVALVCSPVSWSHHWVWLVPIALTLAINAWQNRDRVAATLAVLATAAFYSSPFWLLPNGQDRELAWPWWAHVVGDAYLLVTLAVVGTSIWAPRVLAGRR